MRRLALIIVFAAGCATTKPTAVPRSEQGSDASTVRAQMLVAGARTDLDSLAPYIMVGGAQYLTAVVDKLALASIELVQTREVIRWWSNSWGEQNETITRQDEKLKAYHNRWLGDRLMRAWYWIVGIWLGLGIASMILGGLFATGPISMIARFMLRLLPFSNLFIRGRDIITAKGGTVTLVRDSMGSTCTTEQHQPQ